MDNSGIFSTYNSQSPKVKVYYGQVLEYAYVITPSTSYEKYSTKKFTEMYPSLHETYPSTSWNIPLQFTKRTPST